MTVYMNVYDCHSIVNKQLSVLPGYRGISEVKHFWMSWNVMEALSTLRHGSLHNKVDYFPGKACTVVLYPSPNTCCFAFNLPRIILTYMAAIQNDSIPFELSRICKSLCDYTSEEKRKKKSSILPAL